MAASLIVMALTGCKDDIISGGTENSGPDSEVSSDNYYLALRIYNAASIDAGTGTRADSPIHDSDGNINYPNGGKDFNSGNSKENWICNTYSKVEDCPNFLLVFAEAGVDNINNAKLEYLLPLYDWDYENSGEIKGSDGNTMSEGHSGAYSSYYTFYTSAEKYKLPVNFDNRKVLLVVNASKRLKSKLEAGYRSGDTYSQVLKYQVEKDATDITSADYLCYKFNGEEFLTMTSSMVIPQENYNMDKAMTGVGEYGPAVIKRDFTWKASKEEAVKSPIFSFFIERMQSKYTLTFEVKDGEESKKYYFPQTTDAKEGDGYKPSPRIVISSENLNNLDNEWQNVYYIDSYTRRDDENSYDDNYVKSFMKQAEHFKINITGWGINGTERKEYVFKQIEKNITYYGASYKDWNPDDFSAYRNFWSVDDNYTDTKYPDQYRKGKKLEFGVSKENGIPDDAINWMDSWARIVDDTNVTPWTESMATEDNYVDYFTYKELANRKTHQYSAENTISVKDRWEKSYEQLEAAKKGRAYMRACNHLIITAQLLIHGMEPDGVCTAAEFDSDGLARSSDGKYAVSKYYMNGIFWSDEAYREYVGEYLGYWMQKDEKTFGPNDGILYVTDSDDRSNSTPATAKYFFIEPLMKEGSDGWVHIIPNLKDLRPEIDTSHLTEEERDNLRVFYSYDPETNTYKEITMKQFEVLALSHPEYFAQHFNQGRMYYAVPVIHFNLNSGDPEALYDGKYAAVRNHWYNFNVKDIKKIGSPVDDPNVDLIIPNKDHSYESLGLTLSILPWHLVGDEDVDITDQRQPTKPDEIDIDLHMKADDWIYEGSEYGKEQGF